MNSLRKLIRKTLEETHLPEGYYTTWKKIEEGSPIDQFAGQETEIVNKLAKHFKIGKVAPLGDGTNGFAYYIPNNQVLKITKDKSEAAEAFKIKGKKLKHLANIYGTYALKGKYAGTYVIISELLLKTDDIDDSYEWLRIFFDEEFGYGLDYLFEDYWGGSLSKDEVKDYIKRIKEYYEPWKAERAIWFMTGMFGIIDEIRKNRILSTDWGIPNLGIKKDGNLAMYDLGYGDPDVPEAVNNIHLNEYIKTEFSDISDKEVQNHYTRSRRGHHFAQFFGKDKKPYYISQADNDTFQVHTREGGLKPIAHLYLSKDKDGDTYTPDAGKAFAVQVEPKYRRLGIGSALYDYAEKLGYKINPSDNQYPEAQAMWKKRKPEMKLKEFWSANEYPDFTDGQFNPTFHNRPTMPTMNMNTSPLAEIELSADEINKRELPLQYHYMWGDFIKSKGAAVREIMPNIGDEAIGNVNTNALIRDLSENDPATYDEFAEWIYQSLHGQSANA